MSTTTHASGTSRSLAPVAGPMLESLYQHRVLSTCQLHQMHTPAAGIRWTQRVLSELIRAGLVGRVRAGQGGQGLYHLTRPGADAVELIPTRAEPRRRLITPARAVGPLHAHTLAVNDTGIAFMNTARSRGDECEPLAWRHEIAHPTAPASGARKAPLLIADAVLCYLQHGQQGRMVFHYALVELDRATQPVDALADKLIRYSALHAYTPKGAPRPAWGERYATFPYVLCVLAGAKRGPLSRRMRTALALAAADHTLTATPAVQIRACLLEDLMAEGPFAAIFYTPTRPEVAVNWLGETP